jgi:hypothetical protein
MNSSQTGQKATAFELLEGRPGTQSAGTPATPPAEAAHLPAQRLAPPALGKAFTLKSRGVARSAAGSGGVFPAAAPRIDRRAPSHGLPLFDDWNNACSSTKVSTGVGSCAQRSRDRVGYEEQR